MFFCARTFSGGVVISFKKLISGIVISATLLLSFANTSAKIYTQEEFVPAIRASVPERVKNSLMGQSNWAFERLARIKLALLMFQTGMMVLPPLTVNDICQVTKDQPAPFVEKALRESVNINEHGDNLMAAWGAYAAFVNSIFPLLTRSEQIAFVTKAQEYSLYR